MTQDWTVSQDAHGWRAELGDVLGRGDTPEEAMKSLHEKLDLLRTRLVSLGRSPVATQRQEGTFL